MPLPRFGRTGPRPDDTVRAVAESLVRRLTFELVPMTSAGPATDDLPAATRVSVTCSPTKGIAATLDLADKLLDHGHQVVPHLSARLIEGPQQVSQLARWINQRPIDEVFVVAGDVKTPAGPYLDSLPFLHELFEHDTGLTRVGIAAYPDGHGFIDTEILLAALLKKQVVLTEAGVEGWATTQMCFDADRIRDWLIARRVDGFALPVELGIPGLVDRARLMQTGLRLGVGPSLRYLRKNRAVMGRLLANGRYDPTHLVLDVARDATALGITGLHGFTFNHVAATRRWQEHFPI